jgi:ribulose-phosphate 3-epimerase
MKLALGIKSDPVEFGYSFHWLFGLMADEGVSSLQLGSFFELYHLPKGDLKKLRKQAEDFGVYIGRLFKTHLKPAGFFQEDLEWTPLVWHNDERFLERGSLN